MAIQNVESTLPDKAYIAALERDLREVHAELAQIKQDIVEARGR